MSLFSRVLVPPARRRAARPARAAKGAAPANVVYFVERSVTTLLPSGKKKERKTTREWRHGKCEVKHRSAEAAARCRNP